MDKMTEQQAIKRLKSEMEWEPIELNREAFSMGIKALKEIKQYRAIGTVEECRVAVDRMTPKKPRLVGNAMVCPSCPKVYSSDSVTYCTNCGQHLDWE